MITLTIDLDIPPHLLDYVRTKIKQAEAEANRLFEAMSRDFEALETDEGLGEWLKYECRVRGPVVRASTYNNQVDRSQELAFGGDHFDGVRWWRGASPSDPRRPVLMRGAKKAIEERRGRRRDYQNDIAERFLRRIKYTCFDRKEHGKNIRQFARKDYWDQGHFCATRDGEFEVGYCRPLECWRAWVGGHYRDNLTANQFQYLSRLWGVVEKTRALERRATKQAA